MDNFNFHNQSTAGNFTSSEQVPPQPNVGQYQPVSFAGVVTYLNSLGQAQIPVLPPISQLLQQLRQISAMSVSPHSATQHLPRTGFPPPDPYVTPSSFQPIQFDEGSQLEPHDDPGFMQDLDEFLREKLKDAYVPVEPGGNISGSITSVIISTSQDTFSASTDEHSEKALTKTGERSQQVRRSTRKRNATKRTTKKAAATRRKWVATRIRSTVPLAGPTTVPAGVPVSAHSDISSDSDYSPPDQEADPIARWFVVADSKERPFQCGYEGCGKTYKRRHHLKGHLVKHLGTTKHRCPYSECVGKEYFRDRSTLNRHINTRHKHEKPFQCGICDMRFGRRDHLKVHMQTIHSIGGKKKYSRRKNHRNERVNNPELGNFFKNA